MLKEVRLPFFVAGALDKPSGSNLIVESELFGLNAS